MSYQQTIGNTINTPGGNVQKNNAYSGNQHCGVAETISAGTSTFTELGIDVSQAVSIVISCDRDVTLTVNDDGTPDATISVKADKPVVWTNDGYFTNPLGAVDVTSIKAVLAAGADASLLIDVCYN